MTGASDDAEVLTAHVSKDIEAYHHALNPLAERMLSQLDPEHAGAGGVPFVPPAGVFPLAGLGELWSAQLALGVAWMTPAAWMASPGSPDSIARRVTDVWAAWWRVVAPGAALTSPAATR
jgi:hypothetical protein